MGAASGRLRMPGSKLPPMTVATVANESAESLTLLVGAPYGTRTRVTAVKGWATEMGTKFGPKRCGTLYHRTPQRVRGRGRKVRKCKPKHTGRHRVLQRRATYKTAALPLS